MTAADRTQFSDSEEAARAGRQSGTTERRQVTCPKCGREYRNLPKHLPACDGEVRADGGREQCLSCGHPYDRDEHDHCPNCANGSLDEYATDGGHITDDEFERAVALRKQANPGHEEATEGTLDALENNDHGTPHQTCPFCDATDVRLAEHLPECPGREVRADGGTQGAVDHDYDEAARDSAAVLADTVADTAGDEHALLKGGDVAIDLVTRQPLYVVARVADDLVEYYDEEDFDLLTYKQHTYLPVRRDDPVFKCVFIGGLDDLHSFSDTYDYPAGRLARVPIEIAGGED